MQDIAIAWENLKSRKPINDSEAESYLGLVLEEWLRTPLSRRADALRPIEFEAEMLERNQSDLWLRDFIKSRSNVIADRFLSAALKDNHIGDADRAIRHGRIAHGLYTRDRNVAGAARSELEIVHALRRKSRGKTCLSELSRAQRELSHRSYLSLEIQAHIERSNCETMTSNLDRGWVAAERANRVAGSGRYPALALQALGLQGTLDSFEGRSTASWRLNQQGLQLFWKGTYPDERAFQFYYNLRMDSENRRMSLLAVALQREVVTMIANKGRADFEAIAHFQLAVAFAKTANTDTAGMEFRRAQTLFEATRSSQTRALYEAFCKIGLAKIEIESGQIEQARQHLEAASEATSGISNVSLTLQYLEVRAELAHALGDSQAEQQQLARLVLAGSRSLNSLASGFDRWDWRRTTDTGYRRLLEIQLARPHGPAQALGWWESYRALGPVAVGQIVPTQQTVENPSGVALRRRLRTLRHSTLISYALLPSSVHAWVADNRGVQELTLPVSPRELSAEAHRFYLLCSDPHSSAQKASQAGSRLYQLLVAPLIRTTEPDRTLSIEADGVLGIVPWPALVGGDGQYLGQSRNVRNTMGLLPAPQRRKRVPNSRFSVLVATPGATTFDGQEYLPLPGAYQEASYIASAYPGSIWLQDTATGQSRLLRHLPYSSTFHFAGHAVNRSQGGELILKSEAGAEFLSASVLSKIRMDHTQLVVLSACSTGIAEDDLNRNPNGLIRAFLDRGARQVVATLWEVDSRSSAEFMKTFYPSLASGSATAAALAAARRRIYSIQEFSHPYYWSTFGLSETSSTEETK